MISQNIVMIIFPSAAKFTFPTIASYHALGIGLYFFFFFFTGRTLLPLWLAPAIKKKPPFYTRASITREIMRSKDAQCNTTSFMFLYSTTT